MNPPLSLPATNHTTGLFRQIRNPIMAAELLVIWAVALYLASVGAIIYAIAISIGAHLAVVHVEEPELRKRFGESYEAYLLTNTPEHQDRTCFRLGLSYGFAPEKPQNLRQARNHLQRLVSQFPESPYRAPADLILLLLTQIDKLNGRVNEQQSRITTLTEELQLLKAIDMRRSPSRPSP